jgi:outer membrane protein
MSKSVFAVAALAAALLPLASAQAQDTGDWIVRGRAMYLDPANKGIDGLSVNSKTFPEVDISYFLNPNLALELVLTYPQKHDIRLDGVGTIGSLKHLPPTLSLQYHFPMSGYRPYVGAGINYTHFSNVKITSAAAASVLGTTTVDKNSFGLAIGAGVDVPIGGGWLVNVDLKYAQIRTDVKGSNVGNLGTFKVDPTLFSIGVGKRF